MQSWFQGKIMPHKLSRRQFVTGSAAVAGAVAAGLHGPRILKSAEAEKWGDLTGRFVYDGKPPERKKLKVDKDLECCGKFDIRDESLMVGKEGALANVYVYVRTRDVDVCPELESSTEKRVTLDNRDCIFQPHCMTIWYEKQEFYIVNSDPVAQSVAFTPFGDKPANVVMPVDAKVTWKFGRKQSVPVPIDCVYHPWERAYILPASNPYASISAADGTFKIARLPVGELQFQAWHERIGYLVTPDWAKGRFTIEIKPGTNDLGTIKLDPEKFAQEE